MEEKKLTDEEVAQALLQNIQYGKAITYFDKWGNHKSIKVADILDFIHRLQKENEGIKKLISKTQLDLMFEQARTIEQQKVEIERLTEELEAKKKECREIADDYQEMGTFYYNETVKSAEPQKKVDELKVYLASEKVCSKQAVKDTAKEICEMIDGTCISSKGYLCSIISKRYGVEVE